MFSPLLVRYRAVKTAANSSSSSSSSGGGGGGGGGSGGSSSVRALSYRLLRICMRVAS